MMLYTLNLYSTAGQFCLNKSSRKQKQTKKQKISSFGIFYK